MFRVNFVLRFSLVLKAPLAGDLKSRRHDNEVTDELQMTLLVMMPIYQSLYQLGVGDSFQAQ